jgi:hypothetical protein
MNILAESTSDRSAKRRALEKIGKELKLEGDARVSLETFKALIRPLLRCLADSVEKVRELSSIIIQGYFGLCIARYASLKYSYYGVKDTRKRWASLRRRFCHTFSPCSATDSLNKRFWSPQRKSDSFSCKSLLPWSLTVKRNLLRLSMMPLRFYQRPLQTRTKKCERPRVKWSFNWQSPILDLWLSMGLPYQSLSFLA